MSFDMVWSREEPDVPGLAREFVVSNTSPSGLRYKLAGAPVDLGPVAGCPRESTWPKSMEQEGAQLHPRSYVLSVLVGWERFLPERDGWFWIRKVEQYHCNDVRDALEHELLLQEIELLELHLEAA